MPIVFPADAVEINGTEYSLTGANPNLGGTSNRLGTVYSTSVNTSGAATIGGQLNMIQGSQSTPSFRFTAENSGIYQVTTEAIGFAIAGTARFAMFSSILRIHGTMGLGWASGNPDSTSQDTLLYRDAAGQIGQRVGVSPQSHAIYGTYTSTTNYERVRIYTQTGGDNVITSEAGAGGGTARGLSLRVAGTEKLNIASTGLTVPGVNAGITYIGYKTDYAIGNTYTTHLAYQNSNSRISAAFTSYSSVHTAVLTNVGLTFKVGNSDTTGGGLERLEDSGVTRIFAGDTSSNGSVVLRTGGTDRLTISTSGAAFAAGIGAFGTTPPAAKPSTPVTLADVITILQQFGFAA